MPGPACPLTTLATFRGPRKHSTNLPPSQHHSSGKTGDWRFGGRGLGDRGVGGRFGRGWEVLPTPACPLITLATFRRPRKAQQKPPTLLHHSSGKTRGSEVWRERNGDPGEGGRFGRVPTQQAWRGEGWRLAGGGRFRSQLLLHSRSALVAPRALSQLLLRLGIRQQTRKPPTSNPLTPNVPQQSIHMLGEWGWRFAGGWRFRSQLLLPFWSSLLPACALSQLLLHLASKKPS